MRCPNCESLAFWKNGVKPNGDQLFKCQNCFFQFTKRTQPGYLRYRYPKDVIEYTQKLVFYYGMSVWKTSELLKDFGIDVSQETVHEWCYEKFGVSNEKKLIKEELTGIWYVDETFVKIKGKTGYLWVIKDSNNNVIALYLSKRRSAKEARKALLLAQERAGFKPHTVATDGLRSYGPAVRKMSTRTEHVKSGIQGINEDHLLSTNVVEGYNSKFKVMYHTRRGFKSWENAVNYVSKFELYNCFMNNEQLGGIKLISLPT